MLPSIPNIPEESWRRFPVESLFLPESDVHNFAGKKLTEQSHHKIVQSEKRLEDAWAEYFPEISLGLEKPILITLDEAILNVFGIAENIHVESVVSQIEPSCANSPINSALTERLENVCPYKIKVDIKATETPINVILIHNLKSSLNQGYAHTEINISKNANVNLIVIEGQGQTFTHHRHTVNVEENARLTEIWFKPKSSGTQFFDRLVKLNTKSHFTDIKLFSSAKKAKILSNIVQIGERAESYSNCIIASETGSYIDYEPIQEHRASLGTSSLSAKMILNGRSRSIFQGLIKIQKKALKCKAVQLNKNLSLDKKSRADAIPRLEIEPDDVSCKHGSATGEIDKKQIYYLQSRGFSEAQANRLIVHSFVAQAISALGHANSLEDFANSLLLRLENETSIM